MANKISDDQQALVNKKLFEAIIADDWETFKLCAEKGADFHQALDGYTPLMLAVYYSRTNEWVDFILKKNPDFFVKNTKNETVFDIADSRPGAEKKRLTDFLLKALPTPTAEDKDDMHIKNAFAGSMGLSRDVKMMKPPSLFPSRKKNEKLGF